MKGLIFNYFEQYISETYNTDIWESILENAPLESGTVFVSPEIYPDGDFFSLLNQAAIELKIDLTQILKEFGTCLFGYYVENYSSLIDFAHDPKKFLMGINDYVHMEAKKIMKGATPPLFICKDIAPDKLIMKYYSDRNLCMLVEGILIGVSKYYNVYIEFKQTTCTHRGDDMCTFELTFSEICPYKSIC